MTSTLFWGCRWEAVNVTHLQHSLQRLQQTVELQSAQLAAAPSAVQVPSACPPHAQEPCSQLEPSALNVWMPSRLKS